MALAGELACQQNSYLQELETRVISCEPCEMPITDVSKYGKKDKLSAFELKLEDTVLFPEGGGQPDDRGKIDNVDVLRIIRKGGDALHFVLQPFEVGTRVLLKVNWDRRWDHMQQHSGQHLITAIADQHFGFPTTSWNLGKKTSFIELDTPKMTEYQMEILEKIVNEKIKEGLMMYPTLYEGVKDPALRKVRTRGLPEDHVGPVRVVTIETIENNMCCGTHVSNISHLQIIKLLSVEKGKKGKTNLVFIAGQRVLDYLSICYKREKVMTSYLKGSPEEHSALLDKLQKSFKVAQRNSLTLLREVAALEIERFQSKAKEQGYLFIHRREGDNEYMNTIVNGINDKDVVIFLSVGDDKGAGMFLISGHEELIIQLSPKIDELLDGKGAAKRGRYQGKANKLSRRPQVEKIILETLGIDSSNN